jgi:hypothetical protein
MNRLVHKREINFWKIIGLQITQIPYFSEKKPRMSGGETIALIVDRILNKVIHLLGVLHLLVSPYTKVEESFNLQVNRILQSFSSVFRVCLTGAGTVI